MRKCYKCSNLIPEGMQICPHCGKLPPRLFPQFFVFAFLAVFAAGCAVYFRPFLDSPVAGQVKQGILWVAFVIFVLFALIFLWVSSILLRDYRSRSFKGKLSKAEVERFVKMKKHIESGRHFYEKGQYCTVCGHKK